MSRSEPVSGPTGPRARPALLTPNRDVQVQGGSETTRCAPIVREAAAQQLALLVDAQAAQDDRRLKERVRRRRQELAALRRLGGHDPGERQRPQLVAQPAEQGVDDVGVEESVEDDDGRLDVSQRTQPRENQARVADARRSRLQRALKVLHHRLADMGSHPQLVAQQLDDVHDAARDRPVDVDRGRALLRLAAAEQQLPDQRRLAAAPVAEDQRVEPALYRPLQAPLDIGQRHVELGVRRRGKQRPAGERFHGQRHLPYLTVSFGRCRGGRPCKWARDSSDVRLESLVGEEVQLVERAVGVHRRSHMAGLVGRAVVGDDIQATRREAPRFSALLRRLTRTCPNR
jgi:hypothetical protein